jgi:Mrp family chromosome partitioning ATPase
LERARQGGTGGTRGPIDATAPDAVGRDIASVGVPWEVEPTVVSTNPRGFHVHHPADAASRTDQAGALRDQSTEFVELVQRLFRPATGDPVARSVTFATVGPASSGRLVSLEVARTLARQGGGSVCLVDASLGAAALHAQAVVPIGPGVSDGLLAGRQADSLAVSVEDNLWMVPGGQPMDAWPARLPEVLAGALGQLASRFDFVLVEGGAIERDLGMPTLMTVAPMTDGVVVVLAAERTRRDVAADAVGRLRASGVAVLGAVLTKPGRNE